MLTNISRRSFKESMTSPNTQNKVPGTDQIVISMRGLLGNLKQLFKGNSLSFKKTQKYFHILTEKLNKEIETIKSNKLLRGTLCKIKKAVLEARSTG